MKYNVLLIILFISLLVACNEKDEDVTPKKEDPIEEEEEEEERELITAEFTLTSQDYGMIGGEVWENEGFITKTEAKDAIPSILTNKYETPAAGSYANVTFNIFKFNPEEYETNGYVTEHLQHTVTEQEYLNLGFGSKYFDSTNDIDYFMKALYGELGGSLGSTTIKNTTAIELTYAWYDGLSTTTTKNIIYYWEGSWRLPDYVLLDADYEEMGNGQFNNFEGGAGVDEMNTKFQIYLGTDLYKFDKTPIDYLAVEYKNYVGNGVTKLRLQFFSFDGNTGSLFLGKVPATELFIYDIEKDKWIGDNTIEYTLTSDDYMAIASVAIADGLTDPGQSMLVYGNFDLRTDRSFGWTDDNIIRYIGGRLTELFPSSKEGQKYTVTYDVYYTGLSTASRTLILQNGIYVSQ